MNMDDFDIGIYVLEKWKKCKDEGKIECKNNPTDNHNSMMECALCTESDKKDDYPY